MTEPLVVLLHGWPGLPSDYDDVVARLGDVAHVVPTLAGFGDGFGGAMALGEASADAHARRVLEALPADVELLVVGYDIGSRIAQAMVRLAASRIVGAVLTPGYPGIGARAGAPELADRFWYQHFHRTPLASRLVDGRPEAVRDHVAHLVDAWSATEGLTTGPRFDATVRAYARPGAFAASIAWYRDNVGYADGRPSDVPTTMLWPEADPLFPIAWADALPAWFSDVELVRVPGGHLVPLEAPDAVVAAIERRLERRTSTT